MQGNSSLFQNRYLTEFQLNAMSDAEIYKYCFVPGKKEEWDVDFNREISDNLERYNILKTLSGKPLSYIKTKIYYNMSTWLPEGKKLNPKLLFTLQSILSKNLVEVRNASLTGISNPHLSQSCIKLTEIINKAFNCEAGYDQ